MKSVRAWLKDLSAFDWLLLAGVCGVIVAFGVIAVTPHQPSGGDSSASYAKREYDRPRDSEYTRAAERQGYGGRDAEKVGAAAESICVRTGKC